jgi:hypothetical protein
MPIFLITLFAAILVHLATIAMVGQFMGVKVCVFCLGFGPTIFESGALRLGAIPTGGYVRFRDSVYEIVPAEEMKTALDGRSTFEQLAISLSGCAVLFVLGIAGDGAGGLDAFLNFPGQLLAGASSPFKDAQALTRQGLVFLHAAPFGILASTICAKLAALNLLPFPSTNGGATLAAIARRTGLFKWWHPAFTLFLTLAHMALFASWCLALIIYANSN